MGTLAEQQGVNNIDKGSLGQDYPSFSMILETENLVNADLEGLTKSLESVLQQDLSPTLAHEVIVIDSGDVPPELLSGLQQRFPWMTVHRTETEMDYYAAKMLGARLAQGEIIVYCDSDCTYTPNWLRMLLQPFQQDPQVQVVAGETTTRGGGIYGTAMSLAYIFPHYSQDETLTPTRQYFLNNVAFRRRFLLDHPIPTDLPLYRGNCQIHSAQLRQQGYTLWRQPQARALHAAPNGLSHFFWRFLLIGHDAYWQNRLLQEGKVPDAGYFDPISGHTNKLKVFGERLKSLRARDPAIPWLLPLSLPMIIASALLISVGNLITRRFPHYLLTAYNRLLLPGAEQTIALDSQVPTPPIDLLPKRSQ